jgi:hypothetical protein
MIACDLFHLSILRQRTRRSPCFRAATLPAVPRALPNVRQRPSRISLESTNGRVGLHVSFIVKTHFRHAPESHACLSEVGKDSAAVSLSTYDFSHITSPFASNTNTCRQTSNPRHRFTSHALDSALSAVVDTSRHFHKPPTTCRVISRTTRRWQAGVSYNISTSSYPQQS